MQQFRTIRSLQEDLDFLGLKLGQDGIVATAPVPKSHNDVLISSLTEDIGTHNALANDVQLKKAIAEDQDAQMKAKVKSMWSNGKSSAQIGKELGIKIEHPRSNTSDLSTLHKEMMTGEYKIVPRTAADDKEHDEIEKEVANDPEYKAAMAKRAAVKKPPMMGSTPVQKANAGNKMESKLDDMVKEAQDLSSEAIQKLAGEKKIDADKVKRKFVQFVIGAQGAHQDLNDAWKYFTDTYNLETLELKESSEDLEEAVKVQKMKRMSASERSKARMSYRQKRSKIKRAVKKLHKKTAWKKKHKKFQKMKHGRSAGARKRFIMAGIDSMANLAESLSRSLLSLEENTLNAAEMLACFESVDGICNSFNQKAAALFIEESPEEKKVGYELSYVGKEWDEMDDAEDDNNKDLDQDFDFTTVGDDWDEMDDHDEEGDEVDDDEYEDENDKDYVGAEESVMMDMRCMAEDAQKVAAQLKEGKLNTENAKELFAEMINHILDAAQTLTEALQEEFEYVGQDDIEDTDGKPESPESNTGKYVDTKGEPKEVSPKPEASDSNAGKYVGQGGKPTAQTVKPVSPESNAGKYLDTKGEPKEVNKAPVSPESNAGQYVGKGGNPDKQTQKPVKPLGGNKYIGDEPYGKVIDKTVPVIESEELQERAKAGQDWREKGWDYKIVGGEPSYMKNHKPMSPNMIVLLRTNIKTGEKEISEPFEYELDVPYFETWKKKEKRGEMVWKKHVPVIESTELADKLEDKIIQLGSLYSIGFALKGEHRPSSVKRIVDTIKDQHGEDIVDELAEMSRTELRSALRKYDVIEIKKDFKESKESFLDGKPRIENLKGSYYVVGNGEFIPCKSQDEAKKELAKLNGMKEEAKDSSFLSTEYDEDLRQAALSGAHFDKVNAKEIGDSHGEDPKFVLKQIQELRKSMSVKKEATDKQPVDVVFKKEDGRVVAVFPNEKFSPSLPVTMYTKDGHVGADKGHVAKLKDATPAEYASLKKELEGKGYVLSIKESVEISLGKGNRAIPADSNMGKWMLSQMEKLNVAEDDKEDVAKVLSSIWHNATDNIYIRDNAKKYSSKLKALYQSEYPNGDVSFVESTENKAEEIPWKNKDIAPILIKAINKAEKTDPDNYKKFKDLLKIVQNAGVIKPYEVKGAMDYIAKIEEENKYVGQDKPSETGKAPVKPESNKGKYVGTKGEPDEEDEDIKSASMKGKYVGDKTTTAKEVPVLEGKEDDSSVDSLAIATEVAKMILASAITDAADEHEELKGKASRSQEDIMDTAPDFAKEAGFDFGEWAKKLAKKENIQQFVDKVLVALPKDEGDYDEDEIASEIAHRLMGSGGGNGGEIGDIVKKNVPNRDAAGMGYDIASQIVDAYLEKSGKEESKQNLTINDVVTEAKDDKAVNRMINEEAFRIMGVKY